MLPMPTDLSIIDKIVTPSNYQWTWERDDFVDGCWTFEAGAVLVMAGGGVCLILIVSPGPLEEIFY